MVEQIKAICAVHGTNIKSLEKDLGFGNGTIRRWDERKPSYDRIEKVAKRFNVPISYLTGETDAQQKKPAPPEGNGQIGPNKRKLLEAVDDLSEAEMLILMERIQKLKESRV